MLEVPNEAPTPAGGIKTLYTGLTMGKMLPVCQLYSNTFTVMKSDYRTPYGVKTCDKNMNQVYSYISSH